jgi:hypothetical protein
MFWFMNNDNNDGRFNKYCYLLRVLRLTANVGGTYRHPLNISKHYADLLEYEALKAYLTELQNKQKATA